MKLFFTAFIAFLSLYSFGFISEQIDDHQKTSCVSTNSQDFLTLIEDTSVKTAFFLGTSKERFFKGELISVTIDTETSEVYYKVILDSNRNGYRYLTINKEIGGLSQVAFHWNISQVAEIVDHAVECFIEWK